MRRFSLATPAVFVSLVLMLSGGGLAESFVGLWVQMNGTVGFHKLTANLNRAADPSSSAGLTLDEAKLVEKAWSGLPVAYTVRVPSPVRHESNVVTADVFGVSAAYDRFESVWLKEGAGIQSASVETHSRVAVISSELADRLFGSETVVDRQMEIYGAAVTVIGVFERPPSLLRNMTEDGCPDVWLPVTTFTDLNPNARLQTLLFEAKSDSALGDEQDVRAALTAAGKPPSAYTIVNGMSERNLIGQKPKFTRFAVGLVAVAVAMMFAVRGIRLAVSRYRRELEHLDWQDVWNSDWLRMIRSGAVVVLLLSVAAYVWTLIRFPLYIVPDHIPDNWIDWSFYERLIRSAWQQQINAVGYVPSASELLASRADTVTSWLCFGGLLGIPLGWLGLREWINGGMLLSDIIFWFGVMLTLAFVTVGVIGLTAHSPYAVRYEDMALMTAYAAGVTALSEINHMRRLNRNG